MRTGIAFLTAAALTGCNSPAIHEPPEADGPDTAAIRAGLDEPFTLAPGGTAVVAGADLTLRFLEVAADSRCPVDVTCVWEGDAEVVVETVRAGVERVWKLHFPTDRLGPRTVDVGGYRLAVIGLEPQPRSDAAIAPGSYRATFMATGS